MIGKFLTLFFLTFLASYSVFGQNQTGDRWHYTLSEEYGPERFPPLLYEYSYMEICGDSSVNGTDYLLACVYNPDRCNPGHKNFLFRNDSGKIHVFDFARPEEYMLYDFNLVANDSYSFPVSIAPDSFVTVYIDSVSYDSILGKWRKIQHVHMQGPGFIDLADDFFSLYPVLPAQIIEDIGSTVNFFMWWDGLCHMKRAYNLRCFEQNGQVFYWDSTFSNKCDSVFYWQPNALETISHMIIYPNPTSDYLFVEGSSVVKEVTVLNGQGSRYCLDFEDNRISVKELPSGLYWLQLYYGAGTLYRTPFIVQH